MSHMQNFPDTSQLYTIVAELLDEAKKQGATDAEAGLTNGSGLSVTARLGDVETIEHHREQGLGVTVYFGNKKGSASSNDFNPESVKATVQAACRIAKYASDDPCAGLPEQHELAEQIPDLDLCHPWEINVDQAVDLSIACENAARQFDAEISNSEGASVDSYLGLRILGNTRGFLNSYTTSRHSLSCSVLAERGDSMQRDYWYSVSRDAKQLESADQVGEKAARRAIRRLEAKSLSSRNCPVLYSPEMASGLIGSFIGAISGGNLYRKSSFLLDAIESQVFPEFVRIYEQPLLINGLGSAPYDAEGVATVERDLITDGVLQSYVLSCYSARKLGLKTTGNAGGVRNLSIVPGNQNFNQLLQQMDTGLLITELMGQGVNMVTGDYSRGAAGFWVENGEIQYPVEEITIAGNLQAMFKNLVAVGNDVDYRGNIRSGSLLIEQMSVAGT